MDIRKVTRWAVNIGAFAAAVLSLPELGNLVPVAWVPTIGAVAAGINLILSWIRKVQSGEGLLSRF